MNTPERLLWLLDHTGSPSIQAAYDFSHFELQGIDLEQSLTQLLPRTRFIHVKDAAGDPARPRFLLPGQGRTDSVRYFRLLGQLRYAGPVCVEVSGQLSNQPDYDPRAAIVETSRVLSRALADAAS
jgi:inosose dehydratase